MSKNNLYRTNIHSCYLLEYHLVVVTKYRYPVLQGAIKDYLLDQTKQIFDSWRCTIKAVNTDLYKGAVNSLDANGNTAMYNGLCVAMDRIYKKSQELGGNCTPIIFVLTDGDSNTGYKFSETKDIIAGMNIPIYTISYNYAADSLSELASINEAASIVGNSEDITYKLRNLFNAEM